MSDNLSQSHLMIDTLVRLGINSFIISPGSRSTPLTVAAARHPAAGTIIHFDERGAAFYALGYGKASGKPAVLICTSGTAVANYFPAVIEASLDNVPLIVLSADRPPELIGVGANQAIFQENIYGRYPRLFLQLPPPDELTSMSQVTETVNRLVLASVGSRPGPVHLNCQFREPLLTASGQAESPSAEQSTVPDTIPGHWQADQPPDPFKLKDLTRQITKAVTGLLILGRGIPPAAEDRILKLARRLDWPVFPDVQSRLRFRQDSHIINHFDLALLKEQARHFRPELVVQLGGAFTSKRLLTFLNDPAVSCFAVRPTEDTVDPNHQVQYHFQTDIGLFCTTLLQQFSKQPAAAKTANSYLHFWQQTEQAIRSTLNGHLTGIRELHEPGIAYHLSALLPAGHDLMLANSMAVREMDMFAEPNASLEHIFANRGASGIDGNLATALGIQAASGQPLTLIIGDLAALHDLNSLALLTGHQQALVMILINNRGGGIFNFLPVVSETDVFEPYLN